MRIFAVSISFLLCGCMNHATLNYLVEEYRGTPVIEVEMPEDRYRVFDLPDRSKLMITPSIAASAGQGFAQGLTFNSADFTAPKPIFEKAALQFLTNSGRPNCRIVDAYIVAKPQWEMKYDCTPPAPPAVVQHPATKTKKR